KDVTSEVKIQHLREAYLAKARTNGAGIQALEAIETYFTNISAQICQVERARRAAEPSHLAALQMFADRAYRRPLSTAEHGDLRAFYRKLRGKDQLSHVEAVRDSVAGILLSPHFCYQLDFPETALAA